MDVKLDLLLPQEYIKWTILFAFEELFLSLDIRKCLTVNDR